VKGKKMAMKKLRPAKVVKMAKGGTTNTDMKSMGRNLARAKNQSSPMSKTKMKFASGGVMRGAGAAIKGTKISSKMG